MLDFEDLQGNDSFASTPDELSPVPASNPSSLASTRRYSYLASAPHTPICSNRHQLSSLDRSSRLNEGLWISQAPESCGKRIVCDHRGCSSSFTRRADLKRHAAIHCEYPVYACPIEGCSNNKNQGFHRKDKLLRHIKTKHSRDKSVKSTISSDRSGKSRAGNRIKSCDEVSSADRPVPSKEPIGSCGNQIGLAKS